MGNYIVFPSAGFVASSQWCISVTPAVNLAVMTSAISAVIIVGLRVASNDGCGYAAFAPFPAYSLVIFSHKADLPLLLYQ